MKYEDYNKKIEKISNVLKTNDNLVTTNRKGHNHRDLNFKKNQKRINTNDLDSILSINENYIDCESAVTVGKINRMTIQKEKIVPSLPEGDNFTVGGCLGGIALGSNSYSNGFFNNINSLSVDTGTGYNDSVQINGTYTGTASSIKLRLINSNGDIVNRYEGNISDGTIQNIYLQPTKSGNYSL